ncbi:hypothetical protein KUF83_28530 [Streptomyces sp. BV286]|uniref:hypothetical protein n=1 Tax=Streptomyces sp. BV286 TaxID=2849672 RepID=UPI001C2E12CF|nr:hypothetical protein [Streptomyces sp. BV286]MBV1940486.1 hypothetical protein [Streptomyces sp. BV286]
MRTRIARPLVAASVVAALGGTAACGAGGTAGDGKASPSAAGSRTADAGEKKTPTRRAEATPEAGGADGPLSEAQLKKAALVTGDVKDFEVKASEGADLLGQSVPAKPATCQAVADMFLFTTDPPSAAGVSRGIIPKDETNASVTTLTLLSYEPGEADEVIAGLRSATGNCTAYRHTGYDYKDVKALAGPDLGDESVAFRLVASIEGAEVPAAYTVVRDGTTLVAFSSMNMLDADEVEVPDELVEAQLAKLGKAAD